MKVQQTALVRASFDLNQSEFTELFQLILSIQKMGFDCLERCSLVSTGILTPTTIIIESTRTGRVTMRHHVDEDPSFCLATDAESMERVGSYIQQITYLGLPERIERLNEAFEEIRLNAERLPLDKIKQIRSYVEESVTQRAEDRYLYPPSSDPLGREAQRRLAREYADDLFNDLDSVVELASDWLSDRVHGDWRVPYEDTAVWNRAVAVVAQSFPHLEGLAYQMHCYLRTLNRVDSEDFEGRRLQNDLGGEA